MNKQVVLNLLHRITGGLAPAEGSSADALQKWQRQLAELLHRHPRLDLTGISRLHESAAPAGVVDPESADAYAHLNDLFERPVDDGTSAAPRVFRRETAFRSVVLGSSVPPWGAGLAPTRSFGPFMDTLGQRVWFDIFHRIVLVDVLLKGSTTLLMRLPIRGPLAGRRTYRVEAGSAWIASGLIARVSTLAGYYTGLRVNGGVLELTHNAAVVAGQLVLDVNASAALRLELDQQAAPASPGAIAGIDAAHATLQLPRTLDLRFTAHSSSVAAGPARCKVFGTQARFDFTPAAATWLAPLGQILVPYSVAVQGNDAQRFFVEESASALCQFSGSAAVKGPSGWLLPAALIDPRQLGVATGTGALCLGLSQGLMAQWKGLTGGATALQQPAILVAPGSVSVIDFAARNQPGRQRWTLWKNLHGAHHSDITLTFGKAFALVFISSVEDSEGLFFFCGLRAAFDRPLDGNGAPFRIESTLALAGMQQHGQRFAVELRDNDLLFDGNFNKPEAYERHALILRNAYFKVSRPYSLFLAGELMGEARVEHGTVALSFAIDLYLPTLPDPYVATYTPYLRDPVAIEYGHPQKALSSFVKWAPRASAEGQADDPAFVYFRFAPYERSRFASPAAGGFRHGAQALSGDLQVAGGDASVVISLAGTTKGLPDRLVTPLADTSAAARLTANAQVTSVQASLATLAAHPLLSSLPAATQQIARTLAAASNRRATAFDSLALATGHSDAPPNLAATRGGGGYFGPDLFVLLDVSTHADQMGISLGGALRVEQGRDGANLSYVGAPQGGANAQPSTDLALEIDTMDVVAPARNLRALTLPQVSWEPVWNIPLPIEGAPDPNDLITVAPGLVVYDNDGIPTRIFSESPLAVPMAPLPVTRHFLKEFHDPHQPRSLHASFTLPFALVAQADFTRNNYKPATHNSRLKLHKPRFEHLRGGLQIQALAPDSALPKQRSPEFAGFTLQLDNIRWSLFGLPLPGSTLGNTVKTIFNQEFASGGKAKVPLERIEFSGYGASIFSNWRDAGAAVAEVSQAQFDIIVGRAAHEVIQVRSMLYPFGVHVVRTITLMRSANGYVFRSDSGWKAESGGLYDFDYKVNLDSDPPVQVTRPYEFHAQPVKGVSNVREIRDYPEGGMFDSSFPLNDPTLPPEVLAMTLSQLQQLFKQVTAKTDVLPVQMQAVVFDADVHLDGVVSGGTKDAVTGEIIVQSRKMLGYVQLSPAALLVPARVFADLLKFQHGSLGGPVDCAIDIANSKQRMRLSRVDVNPALDAAGRPIFVTAARGSLILPGDGAWSVVTQQTDTGDVKPVTEGQSVPLIKPNAETNYRISHPADAVVATASKIHFGVLQSTGTQKLLFDVPQFSPNQALLQSANTYFADAYKLLNSKGIFPNIANALGLTAAERSVAIVGEGLMKLAERTLDLGSLLPANYQYAFIDEPGILKVYAEYANTAGGSGQLKLGIDSTAALADRWKAALSDIRVVVDLGPFDHLMWVDGNFNAASGSAAKYDLPHLQFGPVLQPVIDILQILATLSGDDFDRGMDVGMSNSADNWEYKFNCSKEIPVIKFPSPELLTLNPNPPLKLEAGLKVGFYFNQMLSIPTDLKQLVPAAGAYVDFYGRLQVQCFTLGVASVYGVGQVDLGIAADSKAGITLHMKFGFGAEIVVGLPVVANVAVLYMVEVEVSISASTLRVAGLVLFRGSAEICGGLVSVCIQIEAGGAVTRDAVADATTLVAQVSFSIDVCLLWVIDIDYHDSWQETRQIA